MLALPPDTLAAPLSPLLSVTEPVLPLWAEPDPISAWPLLSPSRPERLLDISAIPEDVPAEFPDMITSLPPVDV